MPDAYSSAPSACNPPCETVLSAAMCPQRTKPELPGIHDGQELLGSRHCSSKSITSQTTPWPCPLVFWVNLCCLPRECARARCYSAPSPHLPLLVLARRQIGQPDLAPACHRWHQPRQRAAWAAACSPLAPSRLRCLPPTQAAHSPISRHPPVAPLPPHIRLATLPEPSCGPSVPSSLHIH